MPFAQTLQGSLESIKEKIVLDITKTVHHLPRDSMVIVYYLWKLAVITFD
jgi:hypothetical protein